MVNLMREQMQDRTAELLVRLTLEIGIAQRIVKVALVQLAEP